MTQFFVRLYVLCFFGFLFPAGGVFTASLVTHPAVNTYLNVHVNCVLQAFLLYGATLTNFLRRPKLGERNVTILIGHEKVRGNALCLAGGFFK
jgi:hypothetical protein